MSKNIHYDADISVLLQRANFGGEQIAVTIFTASKGLKWEFQPASFHLISGETAPDGILLYTTQ